MAPHLHLLLLPPALAIATPGRRVGAEPAAGPRARRARAAASFSCSPGRGRRWTRLGVAAAAEGAEPGAGGPAGAMRLNEYMVTVDRPLGVRFALGVDGRVFVHSLRKGVSDAPSFLVLAG